MIPLELFQWNSLPRVLSCAASEVIDYDVSVEKGISVKSDKTGKVIKFMYHHLKANKDGEVLYYVFVPYEIPSPVNRVIIFND